MLDSDTTSSKRRFTFGAEVTLDYARHALGYNFKGLEQGLSNVLRAERNIPADEPVPLDSLILFVFSLGASMDLVEEWVSALSEAIAPYADHPESSFTIRDTTHAVLIKIRSNVVEEVRPMTKHSALGFCD